MEIGEIEKTITIEPVEDPVPRREVEPVPEREPERIPERV